MSTLLVASDIGGTFTDTVTIDEGGAIGRYKAPTVPDDPAQGVLATLELAADERGERLPDLLRRVSLFAHGTTVATNAMLEGKRAPVGLIQTRGFGDTVPIMRGFKSLGLDEDAVKSFRTLVKQELVVPRRLIGEVTERIDYRGRVVLPLDEDDVRTTVRRLLAEGAETFAVSLLWSFKNPDHEVRVGEIIAEEAPDALVSLSSALLPRLGEHQRAVTTALNASLRPVVRRAVRSLDARLREGGMTVEPLLMQSGGGLAPIAEIDAEAASTVMSGPVGGVVACQFYGALTDRRHIVATDMGGTSFEVGLILDGQAHITNSTWVGRHEIGLPSVSVRTVGAGSGSIASVVGGLLRVGPESAGAVPGSACYGRGGTLPTVADADAVLGYLNPENFLGGRLRLDVDAAREAIRAHVAEPLGLGVEEAAEGIKTIVDNRMADLVRAATIRQGYDPADFTLYAYGGAGPTHAFSYGRELGIDEIVVPLTASVHSAFGVAAAELIATEELSDPILSPPGTVDHAAALDPAGVAARFERLTQAALARLGRAGAAPDAVRVTRTVEMRFRAQINELSVPLPDGPVDADTIRGLVARFVASYEARFGEGSAFEAAGIEMTTFRVVARSPAAEPTLGAFAPSADGDAAAEGTRRIFAGGAWRDARVLRHEALRPGRTVDGLAVIEMKDTTVVVGADQTATVDDRGSIVIRLAA
ncbi:hydantoinase/oxoprolinase family protein [Patulibacter sp. SYSU D01012]|uniref:hydantoinase/oxoprolinase family protein n=1 Tax=Patulibacter sp. SYSU D01012 TaxID=2817381 RepID=UPI001B30A996|nr:hydantoinase/oxoprolinase family protein [Patulibacter sp. SYSU D01012]